MEIFLVGGSVRDKLLAKPANDLDYVVVGADESLLLSLGFKPVGKQFQVFLKDGNEYALARTEKSTGKGYGDFECEYENISLKDDLSRRDLTINAMAEDENGNIIDYFNGQNDLQNKILRHVSSAFADDPLRVLRVARFAAELGFNVHESTLELMQKMVEEGMLEHLTAERVWRETQKALASKNVRRFFETLDRCGALRPVFPELYALKGLKQFSKDYAKVDVWEHTLSVLDLMSALSNDPVSRFGALVSHLGSPDSLMKAGNENAIESLKTMTERLRAPKRYKDMGILVLRYRGYFHKISELKAGTILEWFEGARAYNNTSRFEQLLLILLAVSHKNTTTKELNASAGRQVVENILQIVEEINKIDYKKLRLKANNQNEFLRLIYDMRLEIVGQAMTEIRHSL